MDKKTLSNYGWVVVCILVLSIMIAFATPFGSFIGEGFKSISQGLFDVNQNALGAVGMDIPDQEIGSSSGQAGAKTSITATWGGQPLCEVDSTEAQTLYDLLYEQYELNGGSAGYMLPPTEALYEDFDVYGCYIENNKIQNLKNVKLKNGATYDLLMPMIVSEGLLEKAEESGVDNIGGVADWILQNNITHRAQHCFVVAGGQTIKICMIYQPGDTYGDLITGLNPYIGSIREIVSNKAAISDIYIYALLSLNDGLIDLNKAISASDTIILNRYDYGNGTAIAIEEMRENAQNIIAQDIANTLVKTGVEYGDSTTEWFGFVFYEDGTRIALSTYTSNPVIVYGSSSYNPENKQLHSPNLDDSGDLIVEVAPDGSSLKDLIDVNVHYASDNISQIVKGKKYTCTDDSFPISIMINNNNSIDVYQGGELAMSITAYDIIYGNNLIYIYSAGQFMQIYVFGNKLIFEGMLFEPEI